MSDDNGTYVTNRELKTTLNGMRWEFRALLLGAFLAGRFLPAVTPSPNALHSGIEVITRVLT